MDAIASALFEESVIEGVADVGGTVSDVVSYHKDADKTRAIVGIGSAATAGAVAETMLTGAAIGGPIGLVIGAGVSIAASCVAKSIYDDIQ